MGFRRKPALAIAPLALLASPASADEGDWATASDIGVGGLVAWSLGVPLAQGDGEGALQAGVAMAAAQGVSQALKYTIDETRPDGSDRHSFPSAHTSTAFAAAASIFERRGAGEGIPALAVAGLVGLARVEAKKHHWHDALAGAAIGGASGLLMTHPGPDRRMALSAWGDTRGGGVSFAMVF